MGARLCKYDDIEDLIADAIDAYPDSWAITAEEYDELYSYLLAYYLERGLIPEFKLDWGATN